MKNKLELCAGDWVEVRSKTEILRTLDSNARLEELPFMPQMFSYCGRRFQVSRRAHKACDTVNDTGARKMGNAVHLAELRCDGQAYGGCEQSCLLYWKNDWLKPVAGPHENASSPPSDDSSAAVSGGCSESDVRAATEAGSGPLGGVRYVCQATQMPLATQHLSVWDPRQYVDDVVSGNARASSLLASLCFLLYRNLAEAGIGLGWLTRSLYTLISTLRGRYAYPFQTGLIPRAERTPTARLDLKPGEWVRIKSHKEILATINEDMKNRGMVFHAEMVPYCGGVYRVAGRIGKMINEKTGELVTFKNECILLDGIGCVGRYTRPLYCPRGMYPYWREIWLERVPEPASNSVSDAGAKPLAT